jgi:hypothetical protein
VWLLAHELNYSSLNVGVDDVRKMLKAATHFKDNLPGNYDAQMLVMKLGLAVKKIDCCRNGCKLFFDNEFGINDGALEECKFCQIPRNSICRKKRVVVKSMFYLPIIPRLQRMFASMKTASQMTWHHSNGIPRVMRHASEGEAWKHFNRVRPNFAADP